MGGACRHYREEGDSPEDVLDDDFEFLDLDDGGVDSDLGVYDE